MRDSPLKDLTGQVFGRLTALARTERRSGTGYMWLVRCECGVTKMVKAAHLKSGHTRSCGCVRVETMAATGRERKTHGLSFSSIYTTWNTMMERCYNSGQSAFGLYGGAGIRVHPRWHVFENFLADMGERPGNGYSLDRFPNGQGDYEPGNVRWATAKEQANNTKSNVWLEAFGERHTMKQWTEKFGLNYATLQYRLRHGYSLEKALLVPVDHRRGKKG